MQIAYTNVIPHLCRSQAPMAAAASGSASGAAHLRGDLHDEGFEQDMGLLMEVRSLLGRHAPEIGVPSICVVGQQSSGKSSLMEALTGVPLPAAGTLCTRLPIVVTCEASEEGEQFSAVVEKVAVERGSMSEADYRTAVRKAIAEAQTSKVGGSKFSKTPVNVFSRGPGLMRLQLVDLPGLIDSGMDYYDVVNDLVRTNISPESALILVCTKGCQDDELRQAESFVKTIDPSGIRTLKVHTQCDGVINVDARGVLRKLVAEATASGSDTRRHFAAVRDSSGRFVSRDEEVEALATAVESKLATTAPVGCRSLLQRLQPMLHARIRPSLPAMLEALAAKVEQVRSRLEEIGLEERSSKSILEAISDRVGVAVGESGSFLNKASRRLLQLKPELSAAALPVVNDVSTIAARAEETQNLWGVPAFKGLGLLKERSAAMAEEMRRVVEPAAHDVVRIAAMTLAQATRDVCVGARVSRQLAAGVSELWRDALESGQDELLERVAQLLDEVARAEVVDLPWPDAPTEQIPGLTSAIDKAVAEAKADSKTVLELMKGIALSEIVGKLLSVGVGELLSRGGGDVAKLVLDAAARHRPASKAARAFGEALGGTVGDVASELVGVVVGAVPGDARGAAAAAAAGGSAEEAVQDAAAASGDAVSTTFAQAASGVGSAARKQAAEPTHNAASVSRLLRRVGARDGIAQLQIGHIVDRVACSLRMIYDHVLPHFEREVLKAVGRLRLRLQSWALRIPADKDLQEVPAEAKERGAERAHLLEELYRFKGAQRHLLVLANGEDGAGDAPPQLRKLRSAGSIDFDEVRAEFLKDLKRPRDGFIGTTVLWASSDVTQRPDGENIADFLANAEAVRVAQQRARQEEHDARKAATLGKESRRPSEEQTEEGSSASAPATGDTPAPAAEADTPETQVPAA